MLDPHASCELAVLCSTHRVGPAPIYNQHGPTPTARAADLLLPSHAARLDRSILLTTVDRACNCGFERDRILQ